MPATLTASAAAPSSSSDQTGIGMRASSTSASRRAGSAIGTRPAITTVSITSTPNAQRHEPYWANSPPRRGPDQRPDPHIADTSAEALVHSELRQRGVDHRVAQAGEQAPRRALDRTATAGSPWSVRPHTPGCPARTRDPTDRQARTQPQQQRVHGVAATTEATRDTVVTHA